MPASVAGGVIQLTARKPDNRWSRLWLLFVVVAVVLVFSWSKMGQQQGLNRQQAKQYLLLRTEANCNLATAPCAAYAPDYAIVVKLTQQPGWYSIHIRTAGEPLDYDSQVEVTFEPESALFESEKMPLRFQPPDEWVSFIQLPDGSRTNWLLRIKIERDEAVMVADFELPEEASWQ